MTTVVTDADDTETETKSKWTIFIQISSLFLLFLSPSSSEVCRLAWNDAEVSKLAF
jgi:hypothetical protein